MEPKFLRAEEVAQELSVSKPYAYKLIRQLNEELKAKGFITISGRINREYFNERLYGARKENSWITKQNIVETKILPYFGQRKISAITTKDVIAWQNEQLAYRDEKHKPYSQTYLKTLHNQLSAIFNHAVRGFTICGQIPHQRSEIWATRNAGKCCSGRRKSIRNSH